MRFDLGLTPRPIIPRRRQRRHLTRAQMQGLIELELKNHPDRSDRKIAADLGVDPKTVGRVRRALNATGEGMISIMITTKAYEAIKASLPGQRDSPPPAGHDGLIRVWLPRRVADQLGQLRGPGESHSEVILRLARP
jgi:hypothetical protein